MCDGVTVGRAVLPRATLEAWRHGEGGRTGHLEQERNLDEALARYRRRRRVLRPLPQDRIQGMLLTFKKRGVAVGVVRSEQGVQPRCRRG